MVLSWFQVAAASWDRAELAVHTNTTRRRGDRRMSGEGGGPDDGMVTAQLDVAAAAVSFGTDSPDDRGFFEDPQVVGQQIAAAARPAAPSSLGEASPSTRWSTMAIRTGSARAVSTWPRTSTSWINLPPLSLPQVWLRHVGSQVAPTAGGAAAGQAAGG